MSFSSLLNFKNKDKDALAVACAMVWVGLPPRVSEGETILIVELALFDEPWIVQLSQGHRMKKYRH